VRRLAQHDAATAARIGDYQKIIAFRNVLIHGYDLVNHALVWETIQAELVPLLGKTEKLLAESKTDKT
jgi:uncharacterized protein with HEPN domain